MRRGSWRRVGVRRALPRVVARGRHATGRGPKLRLHSLHRSGTPESRASGLKEKPMKNVYYAPGTLQWYVTKRCNLTCTHCFNYDHDESPRARPNELTREQALAL